MRYRARPCWLGLALAAAWSAMAGPVELVYTNSLDGSRQTAVAYVPELCRTNSAPRPLLLVVHFMGGNRFSARDLGYHEECEKRGWLLVCPELHGHRTDGTTSLAALEAQHDAMDAVEVMRRDYRVDDTRIFVAGRSMGGMLAAVLAAKYPDRFAAAVGGTGIYDVEEWLATTAVPALRESVLKECGEPGPATRFDFQRRSACSYAPNFRYVPLLLWHGTADTWVPPEQSERLTAAIRAYNRFQPDPTWLLAAPHCVLNFPPAWVCDRLQHYQNTGESGSGQPFRSFPELTLVTDEAKPFFWLHITPREAGAFAWVRAGFRDGTLSVATTNVSELGVLADKLAGGMTAATYSVRSDGPLRLWVSRQGAEVFAMTNTAAFSGILADNLFAAPAR